ncbi:C45 family autoproteolytic acyltransferase/hydolase [Burkholderia stagnalis]|uniref:C45 family autoproteolytic acyltransferase/hydolase n=1 Tax=Burkholderia stagnalis TaxID=1503054 RepID=UPI000758A8A1|nr:C45 family peptidase [Burkholderia stagnalis]KVN53898.1 peptidase C45 [Burkholderia stagnalis]RQQ45058.1 acyl-CoA--6-aminopenicillanic acid acyltransferase [Burkholderia stagnalis]RQX93992.1 acyl-CoA--6-aminopenicillanic acid acyltransferase [Burkholderia stagnalis]RQY20329.1 acyl-CoA--6-aminopenicillanic acid acyltransferase [Burkholderia stagnalis]RQY31538.1 acyl-CoA--6-aminopenicillanic acid acyltransferase [Burkholderia stagnalis]
MDNLPAQRQQSIPPHTPLVEVSGAPRERGRQYGEQAAGRIRRGVEHYARQLEQERLSALQLREIVARFEPTIASFEPRYIEEMKGIAEGAGVGYDMVVMLNARTEVLKLADRMRNAEPVPIDPDGCTGIVALPAASASGRVIHAQNWDWKAECAESSVVLKVKRDDGPDFLTFTEAGALARSGMNAAGISITANYLECERDYRNLGVPLALIRRKVLEQQRFAFAMQVVYATPKSAANNMMVAHANGVAIDFECAPDETFLIHPKRGVIVHANHFQSPVALSKLCDRGIATMPDSLYRDERVWQMVEPHIGEVTPEIVKAALFDDFEAPWSVCRPPRPNERNNLSATVAMIVMQPDLGIMEVSTLPAVNPVFQAYSLEMAVARPRSVPASVALRRMAIA